MINWTEEMAEQVRYMREVKGMMFRQIATEMGMSKNQVMSKYHRMTGQKVGRDRERPRVWDTNGGNWDTRTFLPYAEWRIWRREKRKSEDVRE